MAVLGQANFATPAYTFTTLAGYDHYGSWDGTGSAARFSFPTALAVDSTGNLYVSDTYNYRILKGFPASSVLPPILEQPTLSAGQFGFGITGLPNLAVDIESSEDLSEWQFVDTYVLVGGTNYFVSPSLPRAFNSTVATCAERRPA